MVILLYAFLLGCICGLRSMTAPAVVAWGAHLGWLHLEGSLLAFFANKISLVIFSLFALGELIADKLPFIPPRTQAGPLGVRILFGAMCGAAVCISVAASPTVGRDSGRTGRDSRRLRRLYLPPPVQLGRRSPICCWPCSRTWSRWAAAFCWSPTCENLAVHLPRRCGHHSVLLLEVVAHECGCEYDGKF